MCYLLASTSHFGSLHCWTNTTTTETDKSMFILGVNALSLSLKKNKKKKLDHRIQGLHFFWWYNKAVVQLTAEVAT